MKISYKKLRARDAEEERLADLDQCIEKLFGHLAPDEVDILSRRFRRVENRMIEIVETKARSCTAMDLFEELEFKPVVFPAELMPLLRRRDSFLATIGMQKNKWEVVYMSKSYREENING